ncbi:MAG: hydroxymethylpyrimidine/phosphomethylpyrimidine kinase [Chitinophagales bacterium]|nr:hydroxymethylpyrimidine/phosphomethylpyrimidine kinase [Chitinophagales bacterium]
MLKQHQYALSIAGFDPSGGAGLVADIKTFEQLNVYGLGVCTANTVQTEEQLSSVKWVLSHTIFLQLEILLKKYPLTYIKIGLIESFSIVIEVIDFLKKSFPFIKIIWDPILSSSSGFHFHSEFSYDEFIEICKKVFLITPNSEEIKKLMNEGNDLKAAGRLKNFTNVFVKSVAGADNQLFDLLFTEGNEYYFETHFLNGYKKHGSGCVLSSAITAFLTRGNNLLISCKLAREYTRKFLLSSDGLLGIHKNIKIEVHE